MEVKSLNHNLRHFIEKCFGEPVKGKQAFLVWCLLLAMLAGCMLGARHTLNSLLLYDLFFLPIILAALFFHKKAYWVVIPGIVFFHFGLNEVAVNDPLLGIWGHDALELLEWLGIIWCVLYALRRYANFKDANERYRRDLSLARTLQTALVPRNYDHGRVRITGVVRQCQEIGGDYYYFRPFASKYLVFCLGDVMGKGTSASMIMAIIMGFFFEWGKRSISPAEVITKLNRRLLSLWHGEASWFTTLFYGVLDEERAELVYASGGGTYALWLHRDGSVEPLDSECLPVGAFDEAEYIDSRITLEENDRVVVFTDGVVEAKSPEGKQFEMEGAIATLSNCTQLDGHGLISRLEKAVDDFCQGRRNDDLAILVMELKPGCCWEPRPSKFFADDDESGA